MRKIASKLLINFLPSAVATFIGGLALHLYLQPPVTPAASPITEIVAAASPPIIMARPNEAAPATVPEPERLSAPAASKATRIQRKGRPASQHSPAAVAARKQSYNEAIALAPPAKASAGSRLTARKPIIGAPLPEVAIVEGSQLSEVPIAPQPFSIAEFKQRLGDGRGGMAAERAWSEEPSDDRFCPFAPKLCAMKALKALSMRTWP